MRRVGQGTRLGVSYSNTLVISHKVFVSAQVECVCHLSHGVSVCTSNNYRGLVGVVCWYVDSLNCQELNLCLYLPLPPLPNIIRFSMDLLVFLLFVWSIWFMWTLSSSEYPLLETLSMWFSRLLECFTNGVECFIECFQFLFTKEMQITDSALI